VGIVDGSGNAFSENGVALGGYADPSIRIPLVSETSATTIRVPADVSTIQQAIDAIAPGGTILIDPGTHREGICLWKPVALQGTADGVELSPRAGTTLGGAAIARAGAVSLENVVIRGRWEIVADEFALRGSTVRETRGDGIVLVQVGHAGIEDVAFREARGTALFISGATAARIDGCSFAENWYALEARGSTSIEVLDSSFDEQKSVGLFLSEGASAVLEACVLHENTEGIQVAGSAELVLRNSALRGTGHIALHISDDATTTADGCTISDSGGVGVYCSMDATLSLSNSFVTDGSHAGLVLADRAVATVRSSKFVDNAGNGIRVEDSSEISLTQCQIARNGAEPPDILFEFGNRQLMDPVAEQSGLLLLEGSRTYLDRVTVSDNAGAGIYLDSIEDLPGEPVPSDASIRLEDCTISGNYDDGIYAWTSEGIAMAGCTISSNGGWGISIDLLGEHWLSGLTIKRNTVGGLAVWGSSLTRSISRRTPSGSSSSGMPTSRSPTAEFSATTSA